MGLISNLSCFGIIFFLLGSISLSSLISAGIYVYNNFEDYSCGNLNYGILVGIITLVYHIGNLFFFLISCTKKISLIIPTLLIICASAYNVYLFDNLSDNCISHYRDLNPLLWRFYIYFLIALFVNIILTIVLVCISK